MTDGDSPNPYIWKMMHFIDQTLPKSMRKYRLLAVALANFLECQREFGDATKYSHLGEDVAEGRQNLSYLRSTIVDWANVNENSTVRLVLEEDHNLSKKILEFISQYMSKFPTHHLTNDSDPHFRWHREHFRSMIRCVFGSTYNNISLYPPWEKERIVEPITMEAQWRTNTVYEIARAIYENRAFDQMPVLSDALEDSGCDHKDILTHCRAETEHVRGCWVVDLILGKE